MDTLIANVAKKKGIRTGVVLAGYDLDRKEPTAVAAPDPVATQVSLAEFNALKDVVSAAEATIALLANALEGYTGTVFIPGQNNDLTIINGIVKNKS